MSRLKTVYDAVIDSDFVSAMSFKKLYEAHEKALDKIEVMEVSAKNAWKEWNEVVEENLRIKGEIGRVKAQVSSRDIMIETYKTEYKLAITANKKLAEQNENITKACHGHIDTIDRLQREAGMQQQYIEHLVIDNVELTEESKRLSDDLAAANRKVERLAVDLQFKAAQSK